MWSENHPGNKVGNGYFRPTAVSDYFLSDNRSPNDIELVLLELIHSSRDALRRRPVSSVSW